MKRFKYLIDIITIPIILIFCFFALYMNVPGYGELCDQDAGVIAEILILFVPICMAFLINNIVRLVKRRNIKFGKISLIVFTCLMTLSLGGLNNIIFATYFRELEYELQSKHDHVTSIKLYKNKRFYSKSFDGSCDEEIIGTYKIKDDHLTLDYDKPSEFISKKYRIEKSEFINLEGKRDTLQIE